MEKILVSACLLGEAVRYDGKDNLLDSPLWQGWQQQGRFVSICPECAGGLPTPRPAAEIVSPPGREAVGSQAIRVLTVYGADVTDAFEKGAKDALKLARQNNIRFAVLKARSPSCGKGLIYDGSFSRTLIDGDGVTAALLSLHGIEVFTEHQLQQLAERLAEVEA
ncbi:DUF523 domain-containing protein [Shewanella sp. JM162201]|uniref:DUF523 domain-containing protein n=1 Tax=Shewanella jiangmenensis TaxID=2837387 RepID=A0ABS5V4L8_9GAMM|nr:DUF523 domain-containing protein [Shewanella jiangmenensis]MBT1445409.1 DUF523 domain-containing protein [Shewanella jiangmenensis]